PRRRPGGRSAGTRIRPARRPCTARSWSGRAPGDLSRRVFPPLSPALAAAADAAVTDNLEDTMTTRILGLALLLILVLAPSALAAQEQGTWRRLPAAPITPDF